MKLSRYRKADIGKILLFLSIFIVTVVMMAGILIFAGKNVLKPVIASKVSEYEAKKQQESRLADDGNEAADQYAAAGGDMPYADAPADGADLSGENGNGSEGEENYFEIGENVLGTLEDEKTGEYQFVLNVDSSIFFRGELSDRYNQNFELYDAYGNLVWSDSETGSWTDGDDKDRLEAVISLDAGTYYFQVYNHSGDTLSFLLNTGVAADPIAVDENGYILPYSSSAYLSETDLSSLSAEECRIARNEIYARHGRMFTDEMLQNYFDACDWYEPSIEPDDFSESLLNEYEIANRDLIVAYEGKMGYR